MTRKEIEHDYEVKSGRITSPGKFEGEMVYVPFYWEVYLEGGGDDDDEEFLRFQVTAEDRLQFPELGNESYIRLLEDDQGFVREV